MNDIKYIKGYKKVSMIFGMIIPKSKTVLIYDVECYMPSPMVFYRPEWFDDCEEISEKEFIKMLHDHFDMILFEDTLAEIVKCGREQNEIQLQKTINFILERK